MIANFVVAFLLFVASNAQNEIFCPDGGDCVDFYLCKNGTIITDGENLLDIRFEGDSCKEDDYTKVSVPSQIDLNLFKFFPHQVL
jgi:hypothetical protein